jgi:O-glycosyl hydrolase
MKIYKRLLKTPLKKRWFQVGLACLIFTASAGVSYSQIVYTFKSSADTTPWIDAGQNVTVTSSFVAGDAPPGQVLSTGALGWTGTFDNAGRNFGGLRLSFPSVDLTGYTDFQFDVKVLNNSFDQWGQIQALQPTLGLTASGNWNQSSVQPQLVNVTTNNGWQHIIIPLTAFSSGSLSDVRQIFLLVDDGNYTSATTMQLAFDNIEFTGLGPVPAAATNSINATNATHTADAQVKPPANIASVTITVNSQPRQTFEGLGASCWGPGEYMQLAPERRAKLNDLVWREGRFKTMRLWVHLKKYAPAPGQRRFKDEFPDEATTLIRDAQAAGVKHIVLGPYEVPTYLLERLPSTVGKDGKEKPGAPHLRPDQFNEHAAIIADFIRDLRDKDHITIEATGVQNEPNDVADCQFTPVEMVRSVKLLRAALDSRGLQQVKIIAPETVGCGGTWFWTSNSVTLVDNPKAAGDPLAYAIVDALKADKAAWKALGGISTHSYDGAVTERMANTIVGTDKEYWMTEFCVGGPEDPGDFFRASVEAATFLSDMNHRVNYWIHFIGYVSNDPGDNGTRLIAYDGNIAGDGWLKIFEQYYYLRQLAQTFDAGAVFRQSISSLEDDMTWARGHTPRITVAAARNPDGSWGIGISDYTSNDFPHHDWNETSLRGKPAQSFAVTVKIEELAKAGELRFEARRIGPQTKDSRQEPLTMRNGQLTVTINPLELVTLHSLGQ